MTEQRQSGCKPIPNTNYNEIPKKIIKEKKP
jgi:hypothetical protein